MSTPAQDASPYRKSVAREYLESIVVAVILALFIRTFAVQAFKIPTGSMEPNLLIGDHLLVNKLVYSPSSGPLEDRLLGKRPIERGHVVVFKFPEDPTRDFIKRVIGLPGETIEVRNKTVFVDGRPLTSRTRTSSSSRCGPTTPSTGCGRSRSATTGGRRWSRRASCSCSGTTGTTAGTAGSGASCRATR